MIITIIYVNVENEFPKGKRFDNVSNAREFYNSLDCPKSIEFNTGNVHHDITCKRIFNKLNQ